MNVNQCELTDSIGGPIIIVSSQFVQKKASCMAHL